MKPLLHSAVAAGGLSFTICLGFIEPLVSPAHSWIYHDSSAPASVFLPALVNIVLIWLVSMALLGLAGRPGRIRVWLWSSLILFSPWLLLKDAALLWGAALPHRLSLAIFFASALSWIVLVSLWRPSYVPAFERLARFSKTMFGFAGLCGILVLGQMFWYFRAARSMQSPGVLHSRGPQAAAEAHAPRPRVIWIILDELSYRQVYERRFPSLELPAFDRLASQSSVFTHVMPAANSTEIAVPSLMTGLPADRVRIGRDGALLSLHNPATGRWQPFQPRNTVFEDALDRGYSTAIAGWYNPYCRILPQVLDRCQWSFREELGGVMISDASLLSNVEAPWATFLHRIQTHRLDNGWMLERNAEAHIADYVQLSSAGDRLLEDPSVNFLLLHIPVPHPGGIYDRRTGSFTTHRASYIDNLALADRYLAHVRQVLEQRGEWDSSAIVVMGDHSWRTKLVWLGTPSWTAEDQAASNGGQFDDRPAYIVKLPHQAEAARIDGEFAAVKTRALLAGILDGSLRSVAELKAFAEGPPPDQEQPGRLRAARSSHPGSEAGRGAS